MMIDILVTGGLSFLAQGNEKGNLVDVALSPVHYSLAYNRPYIRNPYTRRYTGLPASHHPLMK